MWLGLFRGPVLSCLFAYCCLCVEVRDVMMCSECGQEAPGDDVCDCETCRKECICESCGEEHYNREHLVMMRVPEVCMWWTYMQCVVRGCSSNTLGGAST
jgi:hypothetical protein